MDTTEELARRLYSAQAENTALRQMLFQADHRVALCQDFAAKTDRKLSHIEAWAADLTRKVEELEARDALMRELLEYAAEYVSSALGPRHFKFIQIQEVLQK